ncbi:CopG family transcriptional regulator [Maridesulfovibrio sp.]|uniref:CopG family ribbon-helix-helix protein n=1 Tax=Maridesulfovibrio sp. TaxID=2795000 RepID=UPI0029C9D0CB|nr:CopG family transcriptional regulator [Maridesulfovibrio sp.]
MATKQISIRTSPDLIVKLDALANATKRTRSHLVNQAMEEFVAREAWQITEIEKALKEADAGDFATESELAVMDDKWMRNAR